MLGEDKGKRWLPRILVLAAVFVTLPIGKAWAQPRVTAESRANSPSAQLVSELAKMLRAGLPPAVITAYIERWTVPYLTSVDDLLALRRMGANSDVVTAFARRGAELRLQAHLQRPSGEADRKPEVIFLPMPGFQSQTSLGPIELVRPEDFPSSETLRQWAEFNPAFSPWWPFGWRRWGGWW